MLLWLDGQRAESLSFPTFIAFQFLPSFSKCKKPNIMQRHTRLTWVVGFPLQHLQLSALSERVLQAQLQEAGLGPAHPLQQGQQGHRLLALVPALEPAG